MTVASQYSIFSWLIERYTRRVLSLLARCEVQVAIWHWRNLRVTSQLKWKLSIALRPVHCYVDMHPHSVDYMYEATCSFNEAYENIRWEREQRCASENHTDFRGIGQDVILLWFWSKIINTHATIRYTKPTIHTHPKYRKSHILYFCCEIWFHPILRSSVLVNQNKHFHLLALIEAKLTDYHLMLAVMKLLGAGCNHQFMCWKHPTGAMKVRIQPANDVNQQVRMISIQTAEQIKATKLALNKSREDPSEMLEKKRWRMHQCECIWGWEKEPGSSWARREFEESATTCEGGKSHSGRIQSVPWTSDLSVLPKCDEGWKWGEALAN